MGTRSAHERWCSRDESVNDHRGRERAIASPTEAATCGPLEKGHLTRCVRSIRGSVLVRQHGNYLETGLVESLRAFRVPKLLLTGERHCPSVLMVAGGGFEPPTFGLCDLTHLFG